MARIRLCECGECRRCKHREYMNRWYRMKGNAARVRERMRKKGLERTTEQRLAEYHAWLARGNRPDPVKRRARKLLFDAIRRGEVGRGQCECPTGMPCRGRIEGHHEDYAKPLEVRWLCQAHHAELHRKIA